jgi:hypothetical protein
MWRGGDAAAALGTYIERIARDDQAAPNPA